jgi:uncharacterized peroxidase-related enzyme
VSSPAALPRSSTPLDAFKAFPEVGRPILELSEAILRGPSPFSEGERELLAAYVSGLNNCKFCWSVHAQIAAQLGVAREQIPNLATDFSLIEPRMKPVLDLARKLTREPSSLNDHDVISVMAAGWDDVALFHIVCVVSLLNFMNRFIEGLGIEATERQTGKAAEQLAKKGYRPLLEAIRSRTQAERAHNKQPGRSDCCG